MPACTPSDKVPGPRLMLKMSLRCTRGMMFSPAPITRSPARTVELLHLVAVVVMTKCLAPLTLLCPTAHMRCRRR